MARSNHAPDPSNASAWDITFTRMARAARVQVEACALGLARRFQLIGVRTDTQVRQTPRGLSTFLALVGERGLICIADLTVVDGMATHRGPCAALDIRLLDACGDVVAEGLGVGSPGHPGHPCDPCNLGRSRLETIAGQAALSDHMDRAATAVYVATLGHFDLLRPGFRQG